METQPEPTTTTQLVKKEETQTLNSSVFKPEEISEFRQLDYVQIEEVDIPERPERRKETDKTWLFVFIGAIVILIPFAIYTLVHSDLRRLFHGWDPCGNVCGHVNPKIDGISCSGIDYSKEPYLKRNDSHDVLGECVKECPKGYTHSFYHCFKEHSQNNTQEHRNDIQSLNRRKREVEDNDVKVIDTTDDAIYYLNQSWLNVMISTFLAIGIAIGGLHLFRSATAALVWTILGVGTIILLAIFGWAAYSTAVDSYEEDFGWFLVVIVLIILCALGLLILLRRLYHRVKLVILLYKETTKVVFAIPSLILVPIVTAIVNLIVLALLVMFLVLAYSAGVLTQIGVDVYTYSPDFGIKFFIGYSIIVTYWAVQFILGVQYMVIGGCVSTWYFSKDKSELNAPISSSFKNTTIFHLGTVALGSLIITLMAILRALIRVSSRKRAIGALIVYCFGRLEQLLKFVSKNAYIETALHGQPFFKSGKRAFTLLLANHIDAIALNYVGDFVLVMAQLVLISVATIVSSLFFLHDPHGWLPLTVCCCLNVIIVVGTFAVFETTADSLFICFCEDKVINDGLARPYAMSCDFMEFIENAKGVYYQEDKK